MQPIPPPQCLPPPNLTLPYAPFPMIFCRVSSLASIVWHSPPMPDAPPPPPPPPIETLTKPDEAPALKPPPISIELPVGLPTGIISESMPLVA